MSVGEFTTFPIGIVNPLLVRNLITSMFIYADKHLLNLSAKHKLFQICRYLLVSSFLFVLQLLPSIFPSLNPKLNDFVYSPSKPPKHVDPNHYSHVGDSGMSRALTQLLMIVNDIPVSSRKYEIARSLAERLIDENTTSGAASSAVNKTVLSAAFARTLGQLEATMEEINRHRVDEMDGSKDGQYRLKGIIKTAWSLGQGAWSAGTQRGKMSLLSGGDGVSAEKLAAELLWLAQKMTASGFAEEAVSRWGLASKLASLAITAEPRLQGSLVKIGVFLFREANTLSKEEATRQTRKTILVSWLPLLCRASNGSDAPVLNMTERSQLEKVIEELIESLPEIEEQEQVLSLWLHHFMYSPSSDWPNIHASYAGWYKASRNQC